MSSTAASWELRDSEGTAFRILEVAARLFVANGYAGTSTRDIAAKVGIQQPGLYKHFASKDEILRELFRLAVGHPTDVAVALHQMRVEASVALYRFIDETVWHLHRAPYVLASILRTPEMRLPQFKAEQALNRSGEQFVIALVRQGARDGDFRELHGASPARLVLGLVDAIASPTLPETTDRDVTELIEFVFCGLLRDRRRLGPIRRRALALDLPGLARPSR